MCRSLSSGKFTAMNRIHLLNHALELIDHSLTCDLTAASLAGALGYSRSAFDRLFGEVLGDTPARHIRSRRMLEAAWDLAHTHKRIVDIALDFHFDWTIEQTHPTNDADSAMNNCAQ